MTAEEDNDTATRRQILERLVTEGRQTPPADPAASLDSLYDDQGLPT